MTDTDMTMPDGAWEFDADVTAVFDDMLARSIPQYETMRDAVTSLAVRWLPENGSLLDIGCSRGGAIAPIIKARADAKYLGLEISEPMLEAARARFAEEDNVRVDCVDLRDGLPNETHDVVLSVLTLQFTPIEYRKRLLQAIYGQVNPGGSLILVEKIMGETPDLDSAMIDTYYDMKRSNGYSDEAIERKRLALEGVLVPLTAAWNVDALREAGFGQVDCFWRWMNFAGWCALK